VRHWCKNSQRKNCRGELKKSIAARRANTESNSVPKRLNDALTTSLYRALVPSPPRTSDTSAD
jgi:hypothetical protein